MWRRCHSSLRACEWEVGFPCRDCSVWPSVAGVCCSTHTRSGAPIRASSFAFDHVYGSGSRSIDLYDTVAKGIVESAMRGMNGTIFAYGPVRRLRRVRACRRVSVPRSSSSLADVQRQDLHHEGQRHRAGHHPARHLRRVSVRAHACENESAFLHSLRLVAADRFG